MPAEGGLPLQTTDWQLECCQVPGGLLLKQPMHQLPASIAEMPPWSLLPCFFLLFSDESQLLNDN
jgi:hypothetical protein